MITYGLVKQIGPYSGNEPSTYSRRFRQTTIISPKYPYSPYGESTSVHKRSLYAARAIPDDVNLEAPKTKLQRPKKAMQASQLETFLGALFGNTFTVEQDQKGSQGPQGPQEPPEKEVEVKEEEVEVKEEEEEEIEDITLVPYETNEFGQRMPLGLNPSNWRQNILEGVRTVRNVMNTVTLPIQTANNYVSLMMPFASHFLNTQQLTTEGAITLLLGPQYGRQLIRLLRANDEARRYMTTLISDYAVQPSANALRGFVTDPNNYILAILRDQFGNQQPSITAPTSLPPVPETVQYPTLPESLPPVPETVQYPTLPYTPPSTSTGRITRFLDNYLELAVGAGTATDVAARNGPTLLRAFFDALLLLQPPALPAIGPAQLEITGPVGPVGTMVGGYFVRMTPERMAALRRQTGNRLRQLITRRTGMR